MAASFGQIAPQPEGRLHAASARPNWMRVQNCESNRSAALVSESILWRKLEICEN